MFAVIDLSTLQFARADNAWCSKRVTQRWERWLNFQLGSVGVAWTSWHPSLKAGVQGTRAVISMTQTEWFFILPWTSSASVVHACVRVRVCVCVCVCMCVCVCVCSSCVWLFATPCPLAHQAPLSMGLPREEYKRGLPFPPPGDLLNSETEHSSPALEAWFFTTEPPDKALHLSRQA